MQTKKLLGSALALAMMWPGQASAELLKNLKLSGSFELQGLTSNNVEDFQTSPKVLTVGAPAPAATKRDETSSLQHRIMLSLDWDLLDDVHARATAVKRNKYYGNTGAEDVNAIQTATLVQEAWVKVDKVFGHIDTTMGRQFVGTPGDIIAYWGPKEKLEGMAVTALDAVRADWAGEMLTVTALTGKPDGGGSLAVRHTTNDVDVRALLLGLRGQENIAAGAYLWNAEGHRSVTGVGVSPSDGGPAAAGDAGGRNQRLWIAGLKAKAMMGPMWVAGEFAKNFGIQRNVQTDNTAPTASFTGWAFKADGGAKLDVDGVAAFTPWGHFALGTGRQNTRKNRNEDFTAIASDYRPGIVYGRFGTGSTNINFGGGLNGDTLGVRSNSLSNRVIWGLGLKVNPAAVNKLTAGLSYYDFRFHRSTRNPSDAAVASGAKRIGGEVDFDLTWDHSDNVQFGVGAGRFMPGAYIQNLQQTTAAANTANPNSQGSGLGTNPATAAYFDVKIKWGGQQ